MSSLNIPNELTNGSTADATEVQQNFDSIETHTNTEMINRDGSVAMTAQLLLSGAPTSDLGAATKAYADGVLTTDTVETAFIQDDAVTLAKLRLKCSRRCRRVWLSTRRGKRIRF